eukprot:scaffold2159_cov65-Phaeocystis_antarctica.AAC.2
MTACPGDQLTDRAGWCRSQVEAYMSKAGSGLSRVSEDVSPVMQSCCSRSARAPLCEGLKRGAARVRASCRQFAAWHVVRFTQG